MLESPASLIKYGFKCLKSMLLRLKLNDDKPWITFIIKVNIQ